MSNPNCLSLVLQGTFHEIVEAMLEEIPYLTFEVYGEWETRETRDVLQANSKNISRLITWFLAKPSSVLEKATPTLVTAPFESGLDQLHTKVKNFGNVVGL